MTQSKLFRFQNSADTVWHIFLLQANVIKSESFIHHYVQQHWWGPEKVEEEEDLSAIKPWRWKKRRGGCLSGSISRRAKKLIFIRNHLASIFTSTAIDDPRWPCLMGARVLINGGNFPQAQTKKGGNCCANLRRRRRRPHFQPYRLNLLSISEAAVIFCHAESDPMLFYCNKRASRCGWPHLSIQQQFFQLYYSYSRKMHLAKYQPGLPHTPALRITLALKRFCVIGKGCNGKIMLTMLQI